jgi:hypothetical protein
MLYNLGQIRQMCAQNVGVQNSAQVPVYDFDSTTPFTETQVNNWINDTIREVTTWDYTFLESTNSINFWNVISGVQGVYLSGTSKTGGASISGSIIPYPQQQLQYTWTADNSVQDVSSNFSGITFTGTDSSGQVWTGTSVSGVATYNNSFTGITNVFQLNPNVGKIEGVFMQSSANGNTGYGIPLNELTWHDFAIKYPIGVVQIPGQPYEYAKMPGLGPINNPVITTAPFPTPNFSGNSLVLHYLKQHVDLVNDTDTQNVIPQQFQQIIVLGVCEKITSFYAQQDPRTELFHKQKDDLIVNMKMWDFNQANLQRKWKLGPRNGPYGGYNRSAYDTSSNIYIP